MKKLIAILALIAAGSTANAADVTFSIQSQTNGQTVVQWAGTDVLGMALDVTVNNGALSGVTMSDFNVYIDEAYTLGTFTELPASNAKANVDAPGAVTELTGPFALCAGYLAPTNPGLDSGTITFTADEPTTVTLSENAKRGGIVDKAGKATAIGLGAVEIKVATACPGDVNGDKTVNLADLFALKAAFGSTPASANWNAGADLTKDNMVNLADLFALKAAFGTSCN